MRSSGPDAVDGRAASGGTASAGAVRLYLLKDTGQEAFLAARYRLAEFRNSNCRAGVRAQAARSFPPDHGFLPAQTGLRRGDSHRPPRNWVSTLCRLSATPDVPRHKAKAPRIGVWVPWADTDSIGWMRYSLDQRKVPYTYLRDEDIRAGNLRARIDVLLYGHVDLELAEQIRGSAERPGRRCHSRRPPQTPSFGTPAESDDITGGIGWEGLAQIQRFIDDGGLLVTLGSGIMLALEGGLVRCRPAIVRAAFPAARREAAAPPSAAAQQAATRTPGAHVRVTFDRADHPIAYGYPAHTYVFRQNFPLYDIPRHWLRMAYCTTCLDGPEDRSGMVMEWGDTRRSAVRRKRPGMGRREPDRSAGNPRHARGEGTRGLFQLQSDAPRLEPRRSASALECDSQLAGHPSKCLETCRVTRRGT